MRGTVLMSCRRECRATPCHGRGGGRQLDLRGRQRPAALEWCLSEPGDVELGIDLAAQSSADVARSVVAAEGLRWSRIALARLGDERNSPRMLRLQESLHSRRCIRRATTSMSGRRSSAAWRWPRRWASASLELHLLAGRNLPADHAGPISSGHWAAERFAALAHASADPVEMVAADWMLGSTYRLIGHQRIGLEIPRAGTARARGLGHRQDLLLRLRQQCPVVDRARLVFVAVWHAGQGPAPGSACARPGDRPRPPRLALHHLSLHDVRGAAGCATWIGLIGLIDP